MFSDALGVHLGRDGCRDILAIPPLGGVEFRNIEWARRLHFDGDPDWGNREDGRVYIHVMEVRSHRNVEGHNQMIAASAGNNC